MCSNWDFSKVFVRNKLEHVSHVNRSFVATGLMSADDNNKLA